MLVAGSPELTRKVNAQHSWIATFVRNRQSVTPARETPMVGLLLLVT
jgi:hypothetical protein